MIGIGSLSDVLSAHTDALAAAAKQAEVAHKMCSMLGQMELSDASRRADTRAVEACVRSVETAIAAGASHTAMDRCVILRQLLGLSLQPDLLESTAVGDKE